MHITDVHAQLLPVHYREPAVNIGVHGARNRPPHLVGEALLRAFYDRARIAARACAKPPRLRRRGSSSTVAWVAFPTLPR